MHQMLARPGTTTRRTPIQFVFGLLLCVLFAVTHHLSAQIAAGGLTGTVRDSSGAIVVGANMTLTNESTGTTVHTPSTSTGTYVFEAVNPGTYTLRATSPGFKSYASEGVEIHIQRIATIDVSFQTGPVSEEVVVTAAVPLLQAEDAAVGQTIDAHMIDAMPLANRDWTSLAQLAAGVAPIAGGNSTSSNYSVNGLNYFQNDFRLNGIDDNIEVYGGNPSNASIIPPPDAIQEFKLQSGDFSAEFGHSAGGVINAVVKSGGNHLHGNLWEYIRNDLFEANDYFNKQNQIASGLKNKPSAYHQNQFGGTVGGPVYLPKIYNGKDKTFFFFDYQGTRIVQPSNSFSTVPTALMTSSGFTNLQDLITLNSGARQDALNRNFSFGTVFDPSTTRTVAAGAVDPISGFTNTTSNDISVRDPFFSGGSVLGIQDFTTRTAQLNLLPASRLDPNVLKLLQLYPKANRSGFNNNYFQTPKSPNTTNSFDARIDQTFGSKDFLFGVFDQNHNTIFQPPLLPGFGNGQNYGTGTTAVKTYAVSIGYTHLFTPTLTNEFHFGILHLTADTVPPEGQTLNIPAQYGIQGIPQFPGNGGLPAISIGGLAGLGVSPYTPTISIIRTLEYSDNLTKTYGSQTLKLGFQLDSIEGDITQPPYGKGAFTYSGQYSDIPNLGNGLTGVADALLVPALSTVGGVNNVGGVTSFQGTNFAPSNDHRYYLGAYLQDDWKVTPNLTLNLGVRWDRTTPYGETSGRQANFVPVDGNGNTGTYYLPNKTCGTPRSASFDALLVTDRIAIKCVPGLTVGTSQYTNFAPRIGFADRITPSLVLRGGYGIAYGALDNIGFGGTINNNYPFLYGVGFNSPNSSSPIVLPNGQTATIENSFSQISLTDAALISGSGITLRGRQYDFKTPYTQTFNLTFQRTLGKVDSIQAGYVATLSRHLDVQGYNNAPSQLLAPGADLYQNIPFPDFSPFSAFETTNGISNYNSLQVVYNRATSHGLSILANYTLSKCMTDAAEFGRSIGYRAQWLQGFGIGGDTQLCDADSKHLIHASGTYELPVGRGHQFLGASNRLVQTVAGGWSLNYLYTYSSGQPFTVYCNQQTTAFFGCYANLVPGQSLYSGPHNQTQWLNPAAFTNPAVFQTGQSGFAALGGGGQQARGPSFNNLDASLFKEFPIAAQFRMQFRAEAFNVANHPQFANPGNLDFGNASSFGLITGTRALPRLYQFALKLNY
jgi:hypothetical protein